MNMARSSSDETSEAFVHYSENQFEDLKWLSIVNIRSKFSYSHYWFSKGK